MSNKKSNEIRIVRGEDRFAGSSNTDIQINVDLQGNNRNYIEGDRVKILNIEQQFDDERQESTKFRIAGKITNIFDNTITGATDYVPFRNSLYYTNALTAVLSNAENPNSTLWAGYPQYDEFTFYRTRGIEGHQAFVSKSATTYNWTTYVSYASKNNYEQMMHHKVLYESGSTLNLYTVSDGVPYYILNEQDRGKNFITFYCGIKHNLSIGDWIYTKEPIAGKRFFEVYSLGDSSYGNEDKVFSIFNYGYDGTGFGDYSVGNFKRVGDINNTGETTSKYYVRVHKILTDTTNSDITKMGFENNIFPIKKQLEYSALTPNNVQRTSIKDGSMTVGISFDEDIDINNLKDNLDRPITDLYVTILNKGYMGWFNNPIFRNTNYYTGIQVGWDMNFLKTEIDTWWDLENLQNKDDIDYDFYQKNTDNGLITFYYNKDLKKGDEIMGSVCEYNDYENKEVELSEISHKISYNSQIFDNVSENNLPAGYTYHPHYRVPLRVYSDYVEVGDRDKVDLIPDYSFFSKNDNQWRWRDLYPYGFIDTNGNGYNHPFLNNCHYPYTNILFMLSPMKKDFNNYNNIIYAPLVDDCE
jgi:hypothetical protein